jgi:hypothetical protein
MIFRTHANRTVIICFPNTREPNSHHLFSEHTRTEQSISDFPNTREDYQSLIFWIRKRKFRPTEFLRLHAYKSAIIFSKIVYLSLCLINWSICHDDVWDSGCIATRFLDPGTRWRWVFSFTFRLFYPLDRRPGGPQSRSRHYVVEKNILSLPE